MKMLLTLTKLSVLLFITCALARDPAPGWLGYATATYPNATRITYIEAKWVVPENPTEGGGFFSPWFGIETSDNLNLLQPVNPWVEIHWEIYNEYFQWKPEDNYNSRARVVNAGDVLFGSVTYLEKDNSYVIYHSDINDKWSVNTTIKIQQIDGKSKNYNIAYFVMEKECRCKQYPPNNQVTFYDIKIQYDGNTVTPQFSTSFVEDVCNCRAHVLNNTAVQITWES